MWYLISYSYNIRDFFSCSDGKTPADTCFPIPKDSATWDPKPKENPSTSTSYNTKSWTQIPKTRIPIPSYKNPLIPTSKDFNSIPSRSKDPMEFAPWTPVLSTKVSTPAYKNPWDQLASYLPLKTTKVRDRNEDNKGKLDYKRNKDKKGNLDYVRNTDKKGNLDYERNKDKKGNLDYKRNKDKKGNLDNKKFLPLVFPSNEELDLLRRSKEPFIDINEDGGLFTNNTNGDWKKCMIFSEILGKLSEDVESAWKLLDAAIISDPGFALRWLKIIPPPGEEQTPKHFRFEKYADVCKLKQMIENAFPSILTTIPSSYSTIAFRKAVRDKIKMVNKHFPSKKKMYECLYGIENCPCIDSGKKYIEGISTVQNTNKDLAYAKDMNKGETAAMNITEEESSAKDITEEESSAKDINEEESSAKDIKEKESIAKDINAGESAAMNITDEESTANVITEAKDINAEESAAKFITEEESTTDDITEAKDIIAGESAGEVINEKWFKNKVLNANLYDDLTEEARTALHASGEPYLIVLPDKFTIHTANKKFDWRRCLLFSEFEKKCKKGKTFRALARSDPGVLIRWIEAPIYYRAGRLPRAKTFRIMYQDNFNKLKDALEAEFPITIIDFHTERLNLRADPRNQRQRLRNQRRSKKRNENRHRREKEKVSQST